MNHKGGTERMVDAFIRERAKRAEVARTEFFESGEPVPDLDLWPSCPVCDVGEMDYDEHWWCIDCGIEWDRYGENGTIDNDDPHPTATDGEVSP